MSKHNSIQLGVNVDHIATLRQARGVDYPDPVLAADIARKAGADGVTVHLREDRRHIQDHDVERLKEEVALPMNLEMAATHEMLSIAERIQPYECCLVPEKRAELTTEGGLDAHAQESYLQNYVNTLRSNGIKVSLFIDPETTQIESCRRMGVDIIELHTGAYADATGAQQLQELRRLQTAAKLAYELGLQVNAGHGLHYQNVDAIAAIPEIACLNIGHSVISRASLTGMHEAVFSMKKILIDARLRAEENACKD